MYLVYFIFLANPISTRVALGNSSLTALDVMFVGKFPRYNLKKLIIKQDNIDIPSLWLGISVREWWYY